MGERKGLERGKEKRGGNIEFLVWFFFCFGYGVFFLFLCVGKFREIERKLRGKKEKGGGAN